MEKIWLNEYPPGVPSEIDPDAYSSLRELLEQSFQRFRDLPAFTNMDVTLSYDDIDRLSRRFGAYLQKELGLKKGDRVALMMPNILQYPVALFGILRTGLTVVNINPLYTARELKQELDDAGARTIVILENFAHTLEKVLDETPLKTVIVTRIGDLLPWPKALLVNFVVKYIKRKVPHWSIPDAIAFTQILGKGKSETLDEVELTHDDIAFLQYTGGTTGSAKGAVLTHGNLVANIEQASAWLSPWVEEGKEVIITALPLYHIFSLMANCLLYSKLGARNILITNPRDTMGFVKELEKVRFTTITGVNTLFNSLLNEDGFEKLDFSALKITLGGGMAVQKSVAERWKKVTGRTLIEAYGLTETSPAVCVNRLDLEGYNGSVGLPLPSTEVSIRDEHNEELPPGEVGEICIRGPQVMREYWNRPDETADTLTEGWLHSGDMGKMDEKGYIRIVDRKKDMILVSGFNVYPNEIEDVVSGHPGVREVAAVGIPSEKSGEVVKIVVVKKDPDLTAEALIDLCRENLTSYKVPKKVEFRDELPKSNVGKILRRVLREEAE